MIQDRVEELLRQSAIRQKDALSQAQEEIVAQNAKTIADSIATLKDELIAIGMERDKELDQNEIAEDEKRKDRIEKILDEIEGVTGQA